MDNIIKSDYFYGKCVWAIAASENSKQTIDYLFNFFGVDASKMYDALVEFLDANNYFLDDSARENLAGLVRYLKAVLPKNDFGKIDSTILDNGFTLIDGFTLTQYEKRFLYTKAPSSLIEGENKKRYLQLLKSMLVNDMEVLISHSPKCDTRTFEDRKAPIHVNDMLRYIGSVNMIITEYPAIFNNELFLSRVNYVSDKINEVNKTDNTQRIYTLFRDRIK